MIRRELAKDPKLVNESWDRFLPQFRKHHLKTSEKTAKKNEKLQAKTEAREAAGLETSGFSNQKKKVYTPFPPAQQPRKVDLQLESGEYFLKSHEKEAKENAKRKQKACFFSISDWPTSETNPAHAASRDYGATANRAGGSICGAGGGGGSNGRTKAGKEEAKAGYGYADSKGFRV